MAALGSVLGVVRERSVSVSPWPRIPLLALLVWWLFHHLLDFEYRGLIGGLNFGIHELGHVVFATFGQFIGIAGGTIAQCAAPLVAGAMFWRQRDDFGVAFALGWLGTNLFEVAVYVADATAQVLPLVGVGAGEPIHDWNYLLGNLGVLGSEAAIAGLLRVVGGLCLAGAIAAGAFVLAVALGWGASPAKPRASRYQRLGS